MPRADHLMTVCLRNFHDAVKAICRQDAHLSMQQQHAKVIFLCTSIKEKQRG